jgi:uncharacterized protein YqgC (DUF456 family)
VEGALATAGSVGQWTAAIVWIALLAASCFAVLLALPGGWIALALAVLYDLAYGFHAIGWPRLLVFAALLGIGEVVEALLGSVWVARKGASRQGVVGAFVGGIAGAVLGTPVVPVLGTLVGGFAGAFVGAVLGEYARDRRLEPSLRVGAHATTGRFLAVTVKGALATAGAVVVAGAAFETLTGGS